MFHKCIGAKVPQIGESPLLRGFCQCLKHQKVQHTDDYLKVVVLLIFIGGIMQPFFAYFCTVKQAIHKVFYNLNRYAYKVWFHETIEWWVHPLLIFHKFNHFSRHDILAWCWPNKTEYDMYRVSILAHAMSVFI